MAIRPGQKQEEPLEHCPWQYLCQNVEFHCSLARGDSALEVHGREIKALVEEARVEDWRSDAERRERWTQRVDTVRTSCEADLTQAEAEDKTTRIQKWKDWVSCKINRGAKNAHAFIREKEAWFPTTTRRLDVDNNDADDLQEDRDSKNDRGSKQTKTTF